MERDNGFDALPTEGRIEAAAELDRRSTRELVELMNREDATVPAAVGAAATEIAALVDAVAERLERGGRLVYVGAGTSGRLAAVDAAECVATFSVDAGSVVAVVAESDSAEDESGAGADAVAALAVTPLDVVVGVSASGATPYVLGALRAGAARGAHTAAVVCARESELGRVVDHEIVALVGPEVVAGSTRLKAGTAQKLVLNMLSTIVMVRLGKTFGDLMVDVAPANAKLRARIRRIVAAATGAPPERVETALAAADGDAKVAIVSLLAEVDAETARARLAGAGGRIREAVAP
jgi:N-acetylmuramic acid 6-phosphate etherase